MATTGSAKDGSCTVNGLQLHYLEWGPEDAPPIVMLHGLRGSAATWTPVAQPLAATYRILALDQRGRGGSDWAPDGNYTWDAYVSDLEEFVDQLRLEVFVLLGHSMGGMNTFGYAARHPERVRAAVVEDMGPHSTPPPSGLARIGRELERTPSTFASWTEAEAFLRELRPTATESELPALVASSLRTGPDGQITWTYDLEGIRTARGRPGSLATIDLWPAVRALQCPTLVLRGEHSDILSAEMAQAMAEANPHLQWVVIPGATHYVHDDNLSAFNAALAQFLTAVEWSTAQ